MKYILEVVSTGWWFGTMEFYDFPFSWEWNFIIPTDFHSLHHFSEGEKPPTSQQKISEYVLIFFSEHTSIELAMISMMMRESLSFFGGKPT